MLKLSIIIPHRNRNDRLAICIDSLERAAPFFGRNDWEAVVVDNHSHHAPQARMLGAHARVVNDPQDGPLYNKAKALNLGIDSSDGQILTFLDADAIVGKWFFRGALLLVDGEYHRVCYRVRKIPLANIEAIPQSQLFDNYDSYERAFEAYGKWDNNRPPNNRNAQPWGNSQFSITRDALGETRYEEAYEGHGYEDLDMNMRLWAKWGRDYRGCIRTESAEAMFHIDNATDDPTWNDAHAEVRSAARYREKRDEILGLVGSGVGL